jgi:hypothetical protein
MHSRNSCGMMLFDGMDQGLAKTYTLLRSDRARRAGEPGGVVGATPERVGAPSRFTTVPWGGSLAILNLL